MFFVQDVGYFFHEDLIHHPKNQRLDPPKKRGFGSVFSRILGAPKPLVT